MQKSWSLQALATVLVPVTEYSTGTGTDSGSIPVPVKNAVLVCTNSFHA